MIADMAGCPVYIVHTSSRDAHEAIARARASGQRVYGEPIIQHLVLDESEYRNKDWEYAARRVMSPPFRTQEHRDSLWAGLQSGSLHAVATDHCAFTTEQKRLGRTDFTKIPNGTGGLEDRLPVLWTAGVTPGRLTKEEFVAVTSANIARILNIYPKKGAVAVGSDADIIVWDPKATKTITAKKQVSRIDYNVFEGFKCVGLPRVTLSRGAVTWMDGDVAKPAPANTCRAIRFPRCTSPIPCGANSTPRTGRARAGDAVILCTRAFHSSSLPGLTGEPILLRRTQRRRAARPGMRAATATP